MTKYFFIVILSLISTFLHLIFFSLIQRAFLPLKFLCATFQFMYWPFFCLVSDKMLWCIVSSFFLNWKSQLLLLRCRLKANMRIGLSMCVCVNFVWVGICMYACLIELNRVGKHIYSESMEFLLLRRSIRQFWIVCVCVSSYTLCTFLLLCFQK